MMEDIEQIRASSIDVFSNDDDKVLALNVRGIPFTINTYIIDSVPLFGTLFGTLFKTGSNEVIKLNKISPNFLTHLINFYTMDQKYIEFKKILDREFENEHIKSYISYLGIDGLYEKLYHRKNEIGGKLVIYDYNEVSHNFVLSNGLLHEKELNRDAICLLTGVVIIEDCEHYISVQYQDESIKDGCIKYTISKREIISDMNDYYISYKKWCSMRKYLKNVEKYTRVHHFTF
jgi:hypothetical protein